MNPRIIVLLPFRVSENRKSTTPDFFIGLVFYVYVPVLYNPQNSGNNKI